MLTTSTQSYLDSFINFEKNLNDVTNASFKLERVRRLLLSMGNPHQKLNYVHVAGSKGKGSTCALVASILKEAGLRVGLYTSPHMESYRERIRFLVKGQTNEDNGIFDDSITQAELDDLVEWNKDVIEDLRNSETGRLTFYEVFTCLAFRYFYKRNADIVVLETGLGGRLDATNMIDSAVGVITPISLEHTHILGDTV